MNFTDDSIDNHNLHVDPFNRPVLYGILGTICGLWLLGFLYSTKCFRRMDAGEGRSQRGVWGVMDRQQQRDEILARELQRVELESPPEQLAAAREELEKKTKVRKDFVERVLSGRTLTKDVNGEGELCAICLGGYKAGDEVSRSTTGRCQHLFHRGCIAGWLVRKSICPVCREIFLQQDLKTSKACSALRGDPNVDDGPITNNPAGSDQEEQELPTVDILLEEGQISNSSS